MPTEGVYTVDQWERFRETTKEKIQSVNTPFNVDNEVSTVQLIFHSLELLSNTHLPITMDRKPRFLFYFFS